MEMLEREMFYLLSYWLVRDWGDFVSILHYGICYDDTFSTAEYATYYWLCNYLELVVQTT